jgi:hypothetical protein
MQRIYARGRERTSVRLSPARPEAQTEVDHLLRTRAGIGTGADAERRCRKSASKSKKYASMVRFQL